MKIQHNLLAMNANRNIKINTGVFAKTTEKLSSGYKINRAADDAAGLSISEKMRRLIRGLTQASQNCQDGISMVQTAEGALNEVHDMLQRMNELAVQSANGTNAEADREALQQEFAQIQDEIDRVSQTTTFNGMRLFAEGDGGTTNGTNNGNTPSVTSLDASAQTPAVMSMRSMTRATGVTCGDFTVYGGTEGVDFSYNDRTCVLTVLTGTHLTITGTTRKDKIIIGDGSDDISANVTLENVDIDSTTSAEPAIVLHGTQITSTTLNLTLVGNNTIMSGGAGLLVVGGNTLVITEQSTGSLSATGTKGASGIGGGYQGTVGTITINGGKVTAIGTSSASGIGGGYASGGGTITINGGEVTATSTNGAGIGSGGYHSSYYGGTNITISGGTVLATSTNGAGIGGGSGKNEVGGAITISGGTVTATSTDGAGIGGGSKGGGWDVTVSGGTVTATGANGAGIGTGSSYTGTNGGTFSTGTSGNANITATGGNGAENISDTSGMANWSGTINGVKYPLGTIDLSTLTGPLEITDSGYKVGSQEYTYTGDYTFTGTTAQNIIVSSGGTTNINLNGVTGNNISVTNNSTVNLTLNGSNSMSDVTVGNGSTLNTKGSGTLQITNSLDNDGTLNNDAVIENAGTMENSGTITNNGTMENSGTITNNGTLQNEGTVNNNTGGTIDTTNGTLDNSSGTINDNGGTISGTITGNQPVAGGGSGGGTGGTGSAKNSWWIQAGAEAGVGINIEIGAMDTKVLGIEKDTVNILTEEASGNAITAVSGAIEKLSAQRSRLGAYQNRLEHTIRNLDNVVENTTAAESQIRDTDMAKQMVEYASYNIIMQAAQAMLAQANHQPEGVLQLLQ